MSAKVYLKKVTADNWEAMVELELGADQEDLVASTSIRLPRRSSIYCFMIDRTHQGKDYGRTALSKALKDIRVIPR